MELDNAWPETEMGRRYQQQEWFDSFEDYPVGKRANYRACFELKLVCFRTRTVSF